MATEKVAAPTETTATPAQELVLPIPRSYVARIMEVSTATGGSGAFSKDTLILTVKNLEERSVPVTVFISADFIASDESKAKLKILFKGNIVDLTVEDHKAFETGYYNRTKDATGKKVKDLFLTPHEQNTQNFFVNAFETDTVDYRAILRVKMDKDEVSDELELLTKKRIMNEASIAESIAATSGSAFGMTR
jgi:hypothetical protein